MIVFGWNQLLGAPGGFDRLLIGIFANFIVFSLTNLLYNLRVLPATNYESNCSNAAVGEFLRRHHHWRIERRV